MYSDSCILTVVGYFIGAFLFYSQYANAFLKSFPNLLFNAVVYIENSFLSEQSYLHWTPWENKLNKTIKKCCITLLHVEISLFFIAQYALDI